MWKATVSPNENFDCEEACRTLKRAMGCCGTHECDIIEVLTTHSNDQRQKIKAHYKKCYEEDLIEDLKSELGGDFEKVCMALLDPPRVYDAHEIRRAISGPGTCETTLIEIIVTRTNEELEEIKEIYRNEYETELEEDLKSDTSGYFRQMMVSLLTTPRVHDWPKKQVNDISVACKELTGRDLREVIESETSGDLQECFLAIIDTASDLRRFFATRIHEAMAGLGTSDSDLIRLIVSRSEMDLEDVKHIFPVMYEKSLVQWVCDECSGHYRRMLLAIIG